MVNKDLSPTADQKSVLRVIIHSFFVVPFLIALFALIVFLMIKMLTVEPNTAFDYLEQVKVGGSTKRWQGAFELSKILSNPEWVPADDRFANELISTFEYSAHERDPRIRSYLALAMGKTKDQRYSPALIRGLNDVNNSVVSSCIYALGLILDEQAIEPIKPFTEHEDAHVRLQAIITLGNFLKEDFTPIFNDALDDLEPNIRWDAAIALAKIKKSNGRRILLDLLNRKYLDSFSNIDQFEQDQAMLVAIQVVPNIIDTEFRELLKNLSEEDRSMKIREAARKALLN